MTSPTMPSPSPATGAGALLRQAREERGESLAEVSRATRISEDYLSALEEDAPLESFPAPAYARAFARAYARHVGLDVDLVMGAFAATHRMDDPPPQPVVPIQELSPRRRTAITAPLAIRLPRLTGGVIVPQRGPRKRPLWRTVLGSLRPASRVRTHSGRTLPVAVTPAHRIAPRRRRIPVMAWVAAVAVGLGFGAFLLSSDVLSLGSDPTPSPPPLVVAPPPPELPRGGRTIFPDFRVVAFYGAPRTEALGVLGIGPDEAVTRLAKQAKRYNRPDRPVLPAFELISTVALEHPGEDGMYRARQADPLIGGYLDAARKAKMLFIIDVQPGRSDFMTEVKVYEKYLKEPDVGLAIDPEWHVGPGQLPGREIGSVDAKTINQVGNYLAGLVRRYRLPQKLFIIHQFTEDMIVKKHKVKTWPELATTFDVDGWGDRPNKLSKYDAFTHGFKQPFTWGIKLYYEKDLNLLGPRDVLLLDPPPDIVIYQ